MNEELAAAIYIFALVWPLVCLSYYHFKGKIDLLTAITTMKDGKTYIDAKKLAYVGTFAVGSIAFAYLAITDRFTEWYAMLFFGAFVFGKIAGDREQRLNRANELIAGKQAKK